MFDKIIFEENRLFNQDTEMTKVVEPKVREILSRLFKGTDVKQEEFEIAVIDDAHNLDEEHHTEVQAFFIDKKYSEDKKHNMIAVSRNLIEFCKNEDELAGVIGHECGHYLWSQIIGGKNTIFQEHAADLRAVDLLTNGGYNPMNHLRVCERLFSDYGQRRYGDIVTLDVHGNPLARVDDLKAYMTVLANQKGDFKEVDEREDQNYTAFQKKVKELREKEHFTSYLQNVFLKKYGTEDFQKISKTELLQTFVEELDKGNLSFDNYVRLNEMFQIIDQKWYGSKAPTDEKEIQACQAFFLKAHHLADTRPDNFSSDNFKIYREKVSQLLFNFKLERFGPFKKQYENVLRLHDYKTPEEAVKIAGDIAEISKMTSQYRYYGYPQWDGRREKGIGRQHPWDELNDYLKTLPANSQEAKNLAYALKEFQPRDDFYAGSHSFEGNRKFIEDEYYLDKKSNKVLLFGEEAKLRNLRERNARQEKWAKDNFLNGLKRYMTDFSAMDCLARYKLADTKEEKQKQIARLSQLVGRKNKGAEIDNVFLDSEYKTPSFQPYPYFEGVLNLHQKAKIKEAFYHPNDDFTRQYQLNYLKYFHQNKLYNIQNDDKLSDFEKQNKINYYNQQYELDKLNGDTNIRANYMARTQMVETLLEIIPNVKEKTVRNRLLATADEMIKTSFHLNYDYDFEKTLTDEDKKQKEDVRKKYQEQANQLHRKFIERLTDYPDVLLSTYVNNLYVQYNLDLNNKNDTSYMQKIAKNIGFSDPTNVEQILTDLKEKMCPTMKEKLSKGGMEEIRYWTEIDRLKTKYNLDNQIGDKILKRAEETNSGYEDVRQLQKESHNFDAWATIGGPLMIEALKKDQNFDLPKLLSVLYYVNNPSYDRYAQTEVEEKFVNLLGEKIEETGAFQKLPLEDKLYCYEIMQHKELFARNEARQGVYYKQIIDDLETCPDKKEEYLEKLLSLQYITLKNHGSAPQNKFVKEQDRAINLYVDLMVQKYGKDDGTEAYTKRAENFAHEVCSEIEVNDFGYSKKKQKFTRDVVEKIVNRFSTACEAQEKTAEMLAEIGQAKVSGEDAERYDFATKASSALVTSLSKSPENAQALVDFVTHDYSRENAVKLQKQLLSMCTSFNDREACIVPELKALHDNFWFQDLPARAYIMNAALKAFAPTDDALVNKVIDSNFPKSSPYYKEGSRVIKTTFKHMKDYERNYIMSAVMASHAKSNTDNGESDGTKIGEGLKMFFEYKGPAFVKFGQLLSYLGVIDADIRRPLSQLRDKADLPKRHEVFKLMKETLPDSEYKKISHVGKVLGAGSFFITTQVKYDGKDCVVALMRPHARELVDSGMTLIGNVIEDLAQQNSDYKPLRSVFKQAKSSAEQETDIDLEYQKYCEAQRTYQKYSVVTPQGKFKPEVAQWEGYGAGVDNQVYKIMDMAEGLSMTSDKMSEDYKHDMAVAYTTIELCQLLSGEKWDTDRHQGQQNFDIQTGTNGKENVKIGIFDTGAQMKDKPKLKDKLMLGEILYGMLRAGRLGRSVSEYLFDKIRAMDKVGQNLNINTSYIDGVQRGLMALSDVINYQKEVKDDKGKVIQESKSLSMEDMQDMVTAIVNSGVVDGKISYAVVVKDVLNHVRIRRGGGRSLLKGGKGQSPIIIRINEQTEELPLLKRSDKPQEEIDKIKGGEKSKQVKGLDVSRIKNAKTQD